VPDIARVLLAATKQVDQAPQEGQVMAHYNADYWEVPTDHNILDRRAAHEGLYFETMEDQRRRHALQDFFHTVQPEVNALIDAHLTRRQQEVLKLYYFYGKTQEDIAAILNLTQSTVSRHLNGTVRGGKKVGGAITKLRRIIERKDIPAISSALSTLREQMTEAA